MQTRQLGYADLKLTTIGLGTGALGGGGWQYSWGPQDNNEEVEHLLAERLEKVINNAK